MKTTCFFDYFLLFYLINKKVKNLIQIIFDMWHPMSLIRPRGILVLSMWQLLFVPATKFNVKD